MFNKYLFFVLLINGALSDGSDECVRYYFEDFDVLFPKDNPAMCTDLNTMEWHSGSYDNSTVAAPNEKSKWYIKPTPSDSQHVCTPSFLFTMMPGYLVEVKVYFETASINDGFIIHVMQLTETGGHAILSVGVINVPTTGWRVVRASTIWSGLSGNPPFQGYIRFFGRAAQNSVMIVDSFRYVPSSMDPETECILYEDLTTSTETTPKTTTTTPTTTTTTTTTTTVSTPTITVPTTITSITPTTTSPTKMPTTTSETSPDMTPTTTPTTPITTPPKNLTNYFVKELIDFRKYIQFSKKRITKVVNFNGEEQPLYGRE